MIIPAQLLRRIEPSIISPFCERTVQNGKSYGLSAAGYDIRCWEDLTVRAGDFILCSSIERFCMPNDVLGIVHDKSTWARLGIAVQNTVIDPGWIGFLTMELTNHSRETVDIRAGDPIAQIVFHKLLEPTEQPYDGKYQNQERGPQSARFEAQRCG